MGLLDRFKKKITKPEEPRGYRPGAAVKPRPETGAAPAATAPVKLKELSPEAVQAGRILLRPLVTEKAAIAQSKGTYTFAVARTATKGQIQRALKLVYGVNSSAVRIVNVEGKRVAAGRRRGKRSDWKKAMVTLPKGQTIKIHEGV